mmetsp:Transcript_63734/g.170778  ORF Transcript_63734/g.170778 Transcript_63734/m.170778 type:complete len:264 (-) Transcript_63734:484-1275(-)
MHFLRVGAGPVLDTMPSSMERGIRLSDSGPHTSWSYDSGPREYVGTIRASFTLSSVIPVDFPPCSCSIDLSTPSRKTRAPLAEDTFSVTSSPGVALPTSQRSWVSKDPETTVGTSNSAIADTGGTVRSISSEYPFFSLILYFPILNMVTTSCTFALRGATLLTRVMYVTAEKYGGARSLPISFTFSKAMVPIISLAPPAEITARPRQCMRSTVDRTWIFNRAVRSWRISTPSANTLNPTFPPKTRRGEHAETEILLLLLRSSL